MCSYYSAKTRGLVIDFWELVRSYVYNQPASLEPSMRTPGIVFVGAIITKHVFENIISSTRPLGRGNEIVGLNR